VRKKGGKKQTTDKQQDESLPKDTSVLLLKETSSH